MEFVENVPENVSGVEMVEFLFLNENHNKHGDMHFLYMNFNIYLKFTVKYICFYR